MLTMSYMKIKKKTEIVLDRDNPEDFAEWETEIKIRIKGKLGKIGLEHYEGRHEYTLSDVRVNGKYVRAEQKSSALRAPSPLAAEGPRLEHIADRTLMEHLFAQDK